MRVLVTGSEGFLGAALCPRLARAGHAVVGLDARAPGDSPTRVRRDLTAPPTAEPRAALGPFDLCIHLASTVGGFLHNVERTEIVERDLAMAETVIRLCQRASCPRLLFVSTINVFETTPTFAHAALPSCDQRSPYALAKARVERRLAEAFPHLLVLRPTNLFGRTQARCGGRTGESHVIPDLLHKIDRLTPGDALEVLGDGSQVRNFLHVDDLAEFIVDVLPGLSGQRYLNLRSDLHLTIRDLAEQLLALRGRAHPLRFRPEYQRFELFAVTRFDLAPAHALGFAPRVRSLAEGLVR